MNQFDFGCSLVTRRCRLVIHDGPGKGGIGNAGSVAIDKNGDPPGILVDWTTRNATVKVGKDTTVGTGPIHKGVVGYIGRNISGHCGVEGLRAMMLHNQDYKPMWFTEFGWSSLTVGEYNQSINSNRFLQRFEKIINLPREKSDNIGRVDRVTDFLKDHYDNLSNLNPDYSSGGEDIWE